MATVDSVPPEIIAEIFKQTLPDDGHIHISPHDGPLLVSQVSKKWRSIALADSQLWSSFSISVTRSNPPPHVSILALWLERSSAQLLSFTLTMDRFSPPGNNLRQLARPILAAIAAHSARWRRVCVVLPGSQHLLRDLFVKSAPKLESISLTLGNWNAEEMDDINNLLRSAPSLQELIWSNRTSWGSFDTPFDSGMQHLQVDWRQLTDIVLDTWITLKTALDVLRQCPVLVNLNFRHFAYTPDFALDSTSDDCTPIRLGRLQSLLIYQLELDDGLATLFNMLICPNLRHFHYTCGFIELVQWPQSYFNAFLAHSPCQLQSLVLECAGVNEEQLIQSLEHSSRSLTRLEVYEPRGVAGVGDKLLDKLHHRTTPFRDCQVFCPQLRTLILHGSVQCTDGALEEMLQSRTKPRRGCPNCTCATLERVDIRFPKYCITNDADLAYLSTLNLTHGLV
ncbi:hypothetical protein B0H34DRAFT_698465 [Crassisporium funariophilum]|nr:hypothetical protein B0H34DRAFT_698465 [Crassisporium funariophilum]